MHPTEDNDPDRHAGSVSRGQAAVLGRIMAALTRPLSTIEFFGQVLTAIAEQLGSDSTALFFHDPALNTVAVHTCYDRGEVKTWNSEVGQMPLSLPTSLFPIWDVLRANRQAYTLSDPASLPPSQMRDWFLARGMRQVMFAPLVLGEDVIGFLSIPTERADAYTVEDADLAQALAHQISLAVRLGRLAEQASDAAVAAERERAAHSRSAEREAAVLGERNRLAREIHDTLAQAFVGVVTLLEAAKNAATRRPEKAQACVLDALKVAREGLDEARRSVRALRPLPLDGGDLTRALNRLAGRPDDGGPAVVVHIHGRPRPLAAKVEEELYRITREALTNSLRHASASVIGIDLTFELAAVRLAVRDDGIGFNPHPAVPPEVPLSTFGITGMRERAARVGGTFSVDSTPGGGTIVITLVPTDEESE
jgi:signal transduction histidine kinase